MAAAGSAAGAMGGSGPEPPKAAAPASGSGAAAPVFARITEQMIRKRAEHNEGMVSTLEEVALHQQNLGNIEMLGQLCPKLKILYLQNNLISKLQNLHKLKVQLFSARGARQACFPPGPPAGRKAGR